MPGLQRQAASQAGCWIGVARLPRSGRMMCLACRRPRSGTPERKLELITTMGCFAAWHTMVLFAAAVLPIKVTTNSGETLEGNLAGMKAASVLLDQSGQTREISFDDLLSIQPTSVAEKTGPSFQVTLVQGSKIAAQDVSWVDSELVIEPRRQDLLRIPVKQVKAIRFRSAASTTDAQWLGLLQQDSRGDTLVIRRPGDRLDPARGVVEGIADGKVKFNLEGDTIAAPIERLEGVIFGGITKIEEQANITIRDVYGSTWSAIGLAPTQAGEPLQMRLAAAIKHSVPLDQIESMHWSGGIVLLATEKPVTTSVKPYIETNLDVRLLEGFFGPIADAKSDLLMDGGSSIEYRIDEGQRTFSGAVQRAENVTRASGLTVRIKLDGHSVWEEALPDSEPRGFELKLDQARRLTIEVDAGGDGDLGDTVRFIRPRLTK